MVTPTYPRREQVWSKQPLKPPLLIAISLQFKTNAKLVQQRFWYYHETNQQAWLSFAKGLSMFMQKRVISNVFAPFTMILGGKHWFLKITQGIDKKLNPSEARAPISLHKIAPKSPGESSSLARSHGLTNTFADRCLTSCGLREGLYQDCNSMRNWLVWRRLSYTFKISSGLSPRTQKPALTHCCTSWCDTTYPSPTWPLPRNTSLTVMSLAPKSGGGVDRASSFDALGSSPAPSINGASLPQCLKTFHEPGEPLTLWTQVKGWGY